jgi:murein DD-endopeptidase MepM/ murein hydrolase activator NlpD
LADPFAGRYPVTQTWTQHLVNAGPTLGGVDYGRDVGTPLPASSGGVFEWVTALTLFKPKWYNTGLGYAAAVRRPDGTRTIYGHCSGRMARAGSTVAAGQVLALSGGAKGTPGAGKSTGAHVHCHDVLPDGTTRARPFTTGGGASGSAGTGTTTPIPEPALEVSEMKYIHAPAGATTKPLWALIDLVAFRSTGGVKVTTELVEAEDYSRVCPTDAVTLTREQFNESVLAANRLVEPLPPATGGVAVDVDAIAARVAALLAPAFATVNANIDDQPTTFTVTPA